MIVIIGTVPCETGVYVGEARLNGHELLVGEVRFPVERGTAALAAACAQVCRARGLPAPVCIFGGDRTEGRGTQLMFQAAGIELKRLAPDVVTLHYMFPKIVYGAPFVEQVAALPKRPKLIADAGGMYLMKTVGKAAEFDVFTPDEGELYFLADETAPHPLYVRREFLEGEHSVENLYLRAHCAKTTAPLTVIKGSTDRVYENGRKIFELSAPLIPAMEAIGGTGDTVTGLLTAFMAAGDARAVEKALSLNRLIGQAVRCTPATQIAEFIDAIPGVLEAYDQKTV